MLRWALHPRLHEVQFLAPPHRQPRRQHTAGRFLVQTPFSARNFKLRHYPRQRRFDGDAPLRHGALIVQTDRK